MMYLSEDSHYWLVWCDSDVDVECAISIRRLFYLFVSIFVRVAFHVDELSMLDEVHIVYMAGSKKYEPGMNQQ